MGNFVNAVTTPYGTTAFSFSDKTTDSTLGTTRVLMATDPLGQTTRVEFNQNATAVAATEAVVPSGITTANFELNIRNTYIWNPHQYKLAKAGGGLDYSKAKMIHWLFNVDGSVSRVPESVKEPLQSRVWFNYPGQPAPITVGSSSQPTVVARVLDDGSSQVTQYQYNSTGNVVQAVDPAGRKTSYSYASNGIDLLSVVNTSNGSNDVLATMTYDGQHDLLSVTKANGGTTSYTYNAAGQPLTVTDPLGRVTTNTYDGSGYLQSTEGPAGFRYSYTHDAVGRISTAQDSGGMTIAYHYDAADRPTTITYPDGTSVTLTYRYLDLSTVTNRLGQTTSFTYDALRHLIQVADPMAQVVKYGFNPDGKLGSITDANNHTTTFGIDAQGRVIRKTFADSTTEQTVYENSTSRVAKRIEANGSTTSYTYNIDDSVATITYGGSAVSTPAVRFTYDTSYVRPVSISDGTGTTTYTYYAASAGGTLGANRLKTVTSPVAGSNTLDTVTYAYDLLDRATSRSINGGSTQSIGYDELGRVSQVSNALDVFTYTYGDGTPRVQSITSLQGPAANFSYFDGTGNELLQKMSYTTRTGSPLSSFTYQYDAGSNVTKFTETYVAKQLGAAIGSSSQSDYAIGTALARAFEDGSAVGDTANSLMRSSATINKVDACLLSLAVACTFALRAASRKKRSAFWHAAPIAATLMLASCGGGGGGSGPNGSSPGTPSSSAAPSYRATSYAYDKSNRLVSASVEIDAQPAPATPQFVYGYDPASNLTSITANGATATPGYTATNSISSGAYDGAGNPTSLSGQVYVWDAANRLVKVTSGVYESSFTYDGQSRLVRIINKQNGQVVKDRSYLWCGFERCQEHDNTQTGSPVSKQYFAQGFVAGGQRFYYVKDQLGSTRQLIDVNGAVQTQISYDPYGQQTKSGTGIDTDIGYAGYFHHALSNLDFAVYRAYSSLQKRWLNRDPIGELDNQNLYGYVGGNPIMWIDPLGLARSPEWMRQSIPGQIAWDDGRTAWEQGNYGQSVAYTGQMLAEQVITVATLGEYGAGRQALDAMGEAKQCLAQGAERFFAQDSNLFKRGGGFLNNNDYFRIGWNWSGSAQNGSLVFRMAVGNKNSWIHWHWDIWK